MLDNKPTEPRLLAVDHIIPVSQGGSFWNPKNHQIIGWSLHSKKTKREKYQKLEWVLDEFGDKIPKDLSIKSVHHILLNY
jgi:5-methylcytosine-specific restriction endonuclease McrA